MWLLLLFLFIFLFLIALLVFVIATEGRYFGKGFLRRLYSLRAGAFEVRNDWDQWLHFIHQLEISSTDHLLDLGTQTGHLPRLVARQAGFHGSAVGVDWSAEMIREARRQSRLEGTSHHTRFLCADVRQPLPFPDATFTLVVCVTGLLDGLRNPEPLFREIHRVLHPRGRFAFALTLDPQPLLALLKEIGFSAPRTIQWLTTRHVIVSQLEEPPPSPP